MVKYLGEGSMHNMKNISEDLNYFPGHFYDAKEMMRKLSRVGTDVYPIFKMDGNVPTLHYLCILTNLDENANVLSI